MRLASQIFETKSINTIDQAQNLKIKTRGTKADNKRDYIKVLISRESMKIPEQSPSKSIVMGKVVRVGQIIPVK